MANTVETVIDQSVQALETGQSPDAESTTSMATAVGKSEYEVRLGVA